MEAAFMVPTCCHTDVYYFIQIPYSLCKSYVHHVATDRLANIQKWRQVLLNVVDGRSVVAST